jgi:hypothetical protein
MRSVDMQRQRILFEVGKPRRGFRRFRSTVMLSISRHEKKWEPTAWLPYLLSDSPALDGNPKSQTASTQCHSAIPLKLGVCLKVDSLDPLRNFA